MTEESAPQQVMAEVIAEASARKIAEVIAAAMADPTFRQALVDDPESAVRERGIQLDPEDVERLQSMSREERQEMAEFLDTRQSAASYGVSASVSVSVDVDL